MTSAASKEIAVANSISALLLLPLLSSSSSSLLLLLLLHFTLAVRRTATVYEKVYTVMWCRGHTHQGLLLMFW